MFANTNVAFLLSFSLSFFLLLLCLQWGEESPHVMVEAAMKQLGAPPQLAYLKDIGSGKKLKKGADRGARGGGGGGDTAAEADMDKNKTALMFAGEAATLCTCTYV